MSSVHDFYGTWAFRRGSFFGCWASCWSNPLTPLCYESRRTAETALLPFAEPIVAGAHQCDRRLVSSRCLPSKKSEGQTLFRGVCAGALPLLACGGSRRTSSSKLITLRLDPWRAVVSGRFRAKCAFTTSADGYFNEHNHGPLEPSKHWGVFGMTAWLVDSCLFSQRQPPKLRRARGRGHRILDIHHRNCLR